MKKCAMTAACAVLLICSACHEKKPESFVRSVEVVSPESMGGDLSKSFSGVVKEGEEIALGFKTAGQIEKVLVKEGDRVRKGQLIATLDDEDYRLGVEAVQVQYDQLSREVERMRKLYEGKSISGNDYDKAVSGLKQVKVQLDNNKNQLSYTRLYAPVDGIIQSVNFEQAEMVNAGTAVVNLIDVSRMEVECNIPASIYVNQGRFGSITCSASFAPDERIPLTLTSVTPKADGNQLYKMKLALGKDYDKRLTAGMNVDVNLTIAAGEDDRGGFSLPMKSVLNADGKTYVWVLGNDGKVAKREVMVRGVDDNGNAWVMSGLTGEERVVKAGGNALSEGETVRVIEAPSPTNVGGLL